MAEARVRPDCCRLNLGCGQDTPEDWHNVDREALAGVDQQFDLRKRPWPLPTDHFKRVRAEHVIEHLPQPSQALQEIARVLEHGGRAEVAVPIGQNAWADPDHETRWTWDTPEYYCGARHWDVDVGLSVESRGVSVHSHLPGRAGRVYERLIDRHQRLHGAGRWLFDLPATSGEFRVVFRHG